MVLDLYFFYKLSDAHRDLIVLTHSFPTRRSSDLIIGEGPAARSVRIDLARFTLIGATTRTGLLTTPLRERFGIPIRRSEEHTSDLQSLMRSSYDVFCLKKKITKHVHKNSYQNTSLKHNHKHHYTTLYNHPS